MKSGGACGGVQEAEIAALRQENSDLRAALAQMEEVGTAQSKF